VQNQMKEKRENKHDPLGTDNTKKKKTMGGGELEGRTIEREKKKGRSRDEEKTCRKAEGGYGGGAIKLQDVADKKIQEGSGVWWARWGG